MYWNYSQTINLFNTTFQEYSLTFQIPNDFTVVDLYVDTAQQNLDFLNQSTVGDTLYVIITKGIGSNGQWDLIATSTNLLASIETTVGGERSLP